MGLWQKREDILSPEKALNFKPTAVTEPDVSKKVKQCFFMPTPSKKAKQLPNYDVHAKPLSKRPNFWNLALKMPTWQPWLPDTKKARIWRQINLNAAEHDETQNVISRASFCCSKKVRKLHLFSTKVAFMRSKLHLCAHLTAKDLTQPIFVCADLA